MLKKNNLQEKAISSKFNHKEKTPLTENTEDSPQPFIKLKNNKLNFTEKTFTNSEAAFYLFKSTCNKATTVWRSPGTMFYASEPKHKTSAAAELV